MSAPAITEQGRAALRCEGARVLGITEDELGAFLSPLLEQDATRWERSMVATPEMAVWASGLLALCAIPGLVRPRLVEQAVRTESYRTLLARARAVYGEAGALDLEPVLREVAVHVPEPRDLPETLRLLDVAYLGAPPTSLVSVLSPQMLASSTATTVHQRLRDDPGLTRTPATGSRPHDAIRTAYAGPTPRRAPPRPTDHRGSHANREGPRESD